MDLPAKNIESINHHTNLVEGLGQKPKELYQYQNERILAIYSPEEEVLNAH